MTEWGVKPNELLEWTEEKFGLMLRKRNEQLATPAHTDDHYEQKPKIISNEEFFALPGGSYRRVTVN